MSPDENDIVFDTYQVDIAGLIKQLYFLVTGIELDRSAILEWFADAWAIFSAFAFVLSFVLLVGIIYAMVRYEQVSEEEKEILREQERAWKHMYGATTQNAKWQSIEAHIGSDAPSDWRLAIIEADIMLDELLNDLGYTGSSIGEKLKGANPASFATLDDAWKAHKVRNEIAHRGSDFVLTKKIATETIGLYRRVFDEHNALG